MQHFKYGLITWGTLSKRVSFHVFITTLLHVTQQQERDITFGVMLC